jgi:large conductance mechanosensitive channel
MASIREDFKAFITRGNLVQLAIAFVMGAAFTALVTALVADIFTPLIGAAGNVNFNSWEVPVGKSILLPGAFFDALISFVIIALVVFFIIALPYQRWQDRQAAKAPKATPTTRPCPECLTQIPLAAKRCSACATAVTPVATP